MAVDREGLIFQGRARGLADLGLTATALVVSDSLLSNALAPLLEAVWKRAVPIGSVADSRITDEDRVLLTMLASGLKDEAIAQRLDIHVRAVRRRNTRLMRVLNTETLFQAGVRAVIRGWLTVRAQRVEFATTIASYLVPGPGQDEVRGRATPSPEWPIRTPHSPAPAPRSAHCCVPTMAAAARSEWRGRQVAARLKMRTARRRTAAAPKPYAVRGV
ncbi:hypothetical protein [Streptomyces sp. NPDC050264]|uniref:helix-turn-helix transcriptional regulator n=1 Tax=Streptomyces sp. NPDC050264 TaxID=3155038 RepID=UPI00341A3415